MKKTLFVTALVAVLVFAFAASAFAVAAVGNQNGGYFTWINANAAVSDAGRGPGVTDLQAMLQGPHSGYVINSIKCGVCHSVHGAASAGTALTRVVNAAATPDGICVYCHAIDGAVGVPHAAMYQSNGSNHTSTAPTGLTGGGCAGGCHMQSPHGANASLYPLLAKYLLNNRADFAINPDETDTNMSLPANLLQVTDASAPEYAEALTEATAFTCQGDGFCHNTGAFAVMKSRDKVNVAAHTATASYKSGHPVYQTATSDWSAPGAQYRGTVAFNGVTGTTTGCDACHSAVNNDLGKAAFPHNQVNENGTAGGDVTNPSVLWMTKASNASLSDAAMVTDKSNYGATVDGVCLKCHLDAGGTAGVGVSF
jgi:hypothetical protein